jgi:hypothetical protein
MQEKRIPGVHGYGQPTDRGYEIAMDKLTDAIAFVRSQRGDDWAKTISAAMTHIGPTLLPDKADLFAEMDMPPLYTATKMGLSDCEAIYASAEVSAIIAAGFRDPMDPFELRESDLLIPNGFVWLAESIPNFWEDASLVAFAWVTVKRPDSNLAVVIGYSDAFGTLAPLVSEVAFPGDGSVASYQFPIAKLLVSFWFLAQQRLFVLNKGDVSRPVRRRAKARQVKTVIVMVLRRKIYADTDDRRNVNWTHRWISRAHWRNQWYPSQNRHLPIWIPDSVKGPKDKPLVVKQRAFEFRR